MTLKAYNSCLIASALALGALLLPTVANAQTSMGADDKSFNGALCFPTGTTPLSALSYHASGVRNVAAVPRFVSCSVPIDSEETWDLADNNLIADSGRGTVRIFLDYSTAAAGTTTCTAQLVSNATGTVVESSQNSVAGAAGDATVSMTLPNLLQGNANTTALGLSCQLPPQVMLKMVNIEEYSVTHNEQVP